MYLIYAEALLKSKNDLPGAIEQVNKVRARVGLGDLAVCNPGKNLTTDADALLEEILRERACELGLEDVRLFEIRLGPEVPETAVFILNQRNSLMKRFR